MSECDDSSESGFHYTDHTSTDPTVEPMRKEPQESSAPSWREDIRLNHHRINRRERKRKKTPFSTFDRHQLNSETADTGMIPINHLANSEHNNSHRTRRDISGRERTESGRTQVKTSLSHNKIAGTVEMEEERIRNEQKKQAEGEMPRDSPITSGPSTPVQELRGGITGDILMAGPGIDAAFGRAMRIRTPHPHDVLCGRGGSINSHLGNIRYRDWVKERKERYNPSASKVSKASLCREVVDLVAVLNPPGRFLQRMDEAPGGMGGIMSMQTGWWMPINDQKAMAKTSQALREGASNIREHHKTIGGGRRSASTSPDPQQLPAPKEPPIVPMALGGKVGKGGSKRKAAEIIAATSCQTDVTSSQPFPEVQTAPRAQEMGLTSTPQGVKRQAFNAIRSISESRKRQKRARHESNDGKSDGGKRSTSNPAFVGTTPVPMTLDNSALTLETAVGAAKVAESPPLSTSYSSHHPKKIISVLPLSDRLFPPAEEEAVVQDTVAVTATSFEMEQQEHRKEQLHQEYLHSLAPTSNHYTPALMPISPLLSSIGNGSIPPALAIGDPSHPNFSLTMVSTGKNNERHIDRAHSLTLLEQQEALEGYEFKDPFQNEDHILSGQALGLRQAPQGSGAAGVDDEGCSSASGEIGCRSVSPNHCELGTGQSNSDLRSLSKNFNNCFCLCGTPDNYCICSDLADHLLHRNDGFDELNIIPGC